jgi:hypothetical protein
MRPFLKKIIKAQEDQRKTLFLRFFQSPSKYSNIKALDLGNRFLNPRAMKTHFDSFNKI